MLGNLAIQAEKLHKDYPGLTAVSDLDFSVKSGVVHGFLGPNGAGKSTTIRMLCGLLRPTSGRVLVEGFDPVEAPHEVKLRVGLLPENPPLYREMTVREYLRFAAKLHHVTHVESALERVLTQTNTTHVAHRLIGNLSKGYRQRVGIAQALVHDPSLIILDEPTAGLDPESVVEVRSLIKSLKQSKTVLFSSHLLHEVEEVCDTISIIAHGKLLAHGGLDEVREKFAGQSAVEVEVMKLSQEQEQRLRTLPFVGQLRFQEQRLSITFNTREEKRAELVKAMVESGIQILSVEKRGLELEEIFLKVTRQEGA